MSPELHARLHARLGLTIRAFNEDRPYVTLNLALKDIFKSFADLNDETSIDWINTDLHLEEMIEDLIEAHYTDSTPNMDPIEAITASLPPATDYVTYTVILESHLSKKILPTLNDLLQEPTLVQNIGWDLIQNLLPYGEDAMPCLFTIAKLGNPREVVLKLTEALGGVRLEGNAEEEEEGEEEEGEEEEGEEGEGQDGVEEAADMMKATKLAEPTKSEGKGKEKENGAEDELAENVKSFCMILQLLSIVHPRIKTKYPSRFLSTSLIAILDTYRPLPEATSAVISFMHSISGKKRPALPVRKSSIAIQLSVSTPDGNEEASAPDPEGEAEDPKEAAIQQKLLQSFLTHILDVYIHANNGLQWAARAYEKFEPSKVIPNRKSVEAMYKEDLELQQRDTTVGQLLALARDLGLTDIYAVMNAVKSEDPDVPEYLDQESPESPEDIPLSRIGSLYLMTLFVFSAEFLGNAAPIPSLSIFPDHFEMVKRLFGGAGISSKETVLDALTFIGMWLNHHNKYVSGPVSDTDFLEHLQILSSISSSSPSPSIRYHSHLLTSSILSSHPVDRMRLAFIADILEECPSENLKASAVGWLKQELITAHQRKSTNVFSTTVALALARPFLFPDLSSVANGDSTEFIGALCKTLVFHMAVLNFLIFLKSPTFEHLLPSDTISIAEDIYLRPLQKMQKAVVQDLSDSTGDGLDADAELEHEAKVLQTEMDLLGERLDTVLGPETVDE